MLERIARQRSEISQFIQKYGLGVDQLGSRRIGCRPMAKKRHNVLVSSGLDGEPSGFEWGLGKKGVRC